MATATAFQPFSLGGAPLQNKLDLSGVPQMPVNPGMTGQEAILSRLTPLLQQQRTSQETQWMNQGLRPGGEAYDNAANLLGQQENDARTQAILQGLNLDMSANNQGFGQALDQGNFSNNASGQQFNQGMAQQQFGYQQSQDQKAIDAAQHNSMMNGLFSIGGSIGAPLLGKALGIGAAKAAPAIGQAAGSAASAGTAGAAATIPHAATGVTGALGLGGGAGLFGLGAATIPVVGGALAGGAYLAKKAFGNGADRQAADELTGTKTGSGQMTNPDNIHAQFQAAMSMPEGPEKQAAYQASIDQLLQFSKKDKTHYYQAQKTFRDFNKWTNGAVPALLG